MLAFVFSAVLLAQSVTAAVAASPPVSAPAAVTAAALNDAEVQARLARIDAIYQARETYADWWYWGFGTLFAGASLVQTGIAVGTNDRLKRADAIVGASTATLGVYAVATTPVRDGSPAETLRRLPRCTPEDRRETLRKAEIMLRYDAAAEKRARKWTEHMNGAVVSGGAFAILYWGYGLKPQAWMKAASGVVFGQGRVLLAPQHARDGWRAYQAEYRPAFATPEPTWGLIPFLSGAALTVQF